MTYEFTTESSDRFRFWHIRIEMASSFRVSFDHLGSGWIRMSLSSIDKEIEVFLSAVLDPFFEIERFVRNIRDRTLPVEIIIDEEGSKTILSCIELDEGNLRVQAKELSSRDSKILFVAELEQGQALHAFHLGISRLLSQKDQMNWPETSLLYFVKWETLWKK